MYYFQWLQKHDDYSQLYNYCIYSLTLSHCLHLIFVIILLSLSSNIVLIIIHIYIRLSTSTFSMSVSYPSSWHYVIRLSTLNSLHQMLQQLTVYDWGEKRRLRTFCSKIIFMTAWYVVKFSQYSVCITTSQP